MIRTAIKVGAWNAEAVGAFVLAARDCASDVRLRWGTEVADGNDDIEVLTLKPNRGSEVVLEVEGEDEKQASRALLVRLQELTTESNERVVRVLRNVEGVEVPVGDTGTPGSAERKSVSVSAVGPVPEAIPKLQSDDDIEKLLAGTLTPRLVWGRAGIPAKPDETLDIGKLEEGFRELPKLIAFWGRGSRDLSSLRRTPPHCDEREDRYTYFVRLLQTADQLEESRHGICEQYLRLVRELLTESVFSRPLHRVVARPLAVTDLDRFHDKCETTCRQALCSLTDAPRPTRADITDITTAILEGSDRILLSEGTRAGGLQELLGKATRNVCLHLYGTRSNTDELLRLLAEHGPERKAPREYLWPGILGENWREKATSALHALKPLQQWVLVRWNVKQESYAEIADNVDLPAAKDAWRVEHDASQEYERELAEV